MSKFNKELIEKLKIGELALEYDGKSLDELKAILKEAFPRDGGHINGIPKYYYALSNFSTYWYSSYHEVENKEIIPIKDFIQEEFVLPEKWCVKPVDDKQLEIIYNHVDKNGNSLKRMGEAKSIIFYYHFPATNNRDFFAYQKPQKGYTEITFEQFKEHILKEKTMYKYTPEYVKNNKVAIHVQNKEEYEKSVKILDFNHDFPHISFYFALYHPSTPNKISYTQDYTSSWYSTNNYEIIEAEDFIKNNTKECNMENKKILGYKAPYDLYNGNIKKGDLVEDLENKTTGNNRFHKGEYGIIKTGSFWLIPKEIVEQWEPVYSSNLPKINGIEGKIENNKVIYGCQSYLVEDLKLLLQNWKTFKFDNIIKINSYEICKTELEQVLNAVKNI